MSAAAILISILALPLAVAGQNIAAAVAGLLMVVSITRQRRWSEVWALASRAKWPLVGSVGFTGVLVLATVLNPSNHSREWLGTVWGHAFWIGLPLLGTVAATHVEGLLRYGLIATAIVGAIVGMIAVSQAIWGWRVEGMAFVAGPTRAYGLYSHPLTFAYVGLCLWPLGVLAVLERPRRWTGWAIFLGAGAVVVCTQSRTVQAVAAATLLINVLTRTKRTMRWTIVAAVTAVLTLILVTDNTIGYRFRKTFTGGFDVRSDYPDDRLAFWHAHWLMLKEKPWLGHGDHLNTGYRAPYYEALGLGAFERQYEAHNTYLQAAVNGGLVGLALFLLWGAWHGRQARLIKQNHPAVGSVLWQTLAVLAVAATTQNAFQDAEVRYALSLWTWAVWLGSFERVRFEINNSLQAF